MPPQVEGNKQALFLRMIFLVLIYKNASRLFKEDSIIFFGKLKRFVRDKVERSKMATASTIDETDRCLALQNRQLRLRDEVLLKVGSRLSGIFFDMGF